MAYIYESINCPHYHKYSYYQINTWSNDGNLQIENDYIECVYCGERMYIGNSIINVLIRPQKPMS